MKRYYLLVAVCFVGYIGQSQVGIGNTDPKSSLDISASNTATPSNTDGILIPRIDNFPSADPGADQDGMLVFVTGNGTPSEGFYYWDNGSGGWVSVSGAGSDSDWYEAGTSAPANNINDDIFHLGNVTIGTNTASPSSPVLVQGDVSADQANISSTISGAYASGTYTGLSTSGALSGAGNYTSLNNIIGGSNDGTLRGINNVFSNSGAGQKIGSENTFNSADGVRKGYRNYFATGNSISMGLENQAPGAFSISGALYGLKNDLSSAGNGQRYGVHSVINGTGTGAKYGEFIQINSGAGGQHYGVYSDVQNASGYAGYFIGRASFGTDPSTGRYLLPAADGTAGQVITTNGTGQLTFADTSGADRIDDLADGKSDIDGTNNGSSIFLGIDAGSSDDSSDNQNLGIGYRSMFATTTGAFNTALGYGTLQANTTSSYHTGVGHEALAALNGGSGNVALGYRSLYNTTNASDNVGLGLQSLFSNTTGVSNVALGSNALYNNTSGNQNVALGRDAAYNYSGSRGVFIGYQAGYNETTGNRLYIENSNADPSNALIYGEFDNDILRTNATFQIGVPSGTGYAFPTSDGTAGQVLATDGSGLISFTDPSADADWYEVGATTAPNAIGDDMFTQGNVVIGATSNPANVKLYVESDAASNTIGIRQTIGAATSGILRGIDNNVTVNGTANAYAVSNSIGGNSTGLTIQAVRNSFNGNGGRKTGVFNSFATGFGGEARGVENDFNNSSISSAFGSYNRFTSLSNSANAHGVFNTASGSTTATNLYGTRTIFSGSTVAGDAYGDYSFIQTSGTDYGIYAHVDNNAIDYAGYFVGRTSFGTDSAVGRYLLPAADGTAGQLMATNGSGQLGFIDAVDTQNSLDGAYDEGGPGAGRIINADVGSVEIVASGSTGIAQVITHNQAGSGLQLNLNGNLNASGTTIPGLEINNLMNTNGSFTNTYSIFSKMASNGGSVDGKNYGIRNWFQPAGNSAGTLYGFHSEMQNTGNGEHYSYFSRMSTAGTGNKFGFYSEILPTSGGTHYGVYSEALKTGSFAAYFLGSVSVGTTTSNNYILPSSRGTVNQIMQTNGVGAVTWVDPSTVFTDTDDQTVDTFALVGNSIGISLEDDGQPVQTVDLSNVDFNVSNFALAKMNMTLGQTLSPPSWTKLDFNTAVFDLGSDFDPGTDRFDVSETGYYRITATIKSSNTSTATNQFGVAVYVDGTLVKSDTYHHQGNGVVSRKVETIESLTTGQYIEIYAYAQTGITITNDPTATSFEVERIR